MQSPPPPGTLVWLRQRRWRVERTRIDRHVVRIDVAHQHQRLTVLAPFDRPEPIAPRRRPVIVRRQHAIARLAYLFGSARASRGVRAALDARIDLWPHQFEPVLAVLDGQRRLLIADEVGLGKTIQAGLILAELSQRRPALRALIVAPAGLCDQWTRELRDRFQIDVQTGERVRSTTTLRSTPVGSNPWRRPGVWIASIDYIKQRHVIDGLPAIPWDIVIVDEAHIAAGASDRHDACDELGRRARHFVLLSATPHSGDDTRFARLLRLGALPFGTDRMTVFRRTRADVSLPHGRVVRWHRVRPSSDVTRVLDALQAFEHVILRRVRASRRDVALLLLAVFRKRALSTMAALDRTLARRLDWIDAPSPHAPPDWLQSRLDFGDADDMDDDERVALAADVGLPTAQERTWLRRLRTLAAVAIGRESKIARLRALVGRTREPVVIFTEFRHSLEHVQRALSPIRSVAVLHGGQAGPVRRHELDRFLGGDVSVLVATDVGGQGLNLQSRARWIVNLELPWNPARIEQRIGRVDRLGQTRRVHATLLVTAHPSENALLIALAARTLAARQAIGATTLADVAPPPHLAVAAALLNQDTLPTHTPVSRAIPFDVSYRRAANAAARVTSARRALKRVWRGPRPAGTRTLRTHACPPGFVRAAKGVLIFSVPILDRTGEVIERRLVAVATTVRPNQLLSTSDGRTALDAYALRRAHARLARLRRHAITAARRRLEAERAIALQLHALLYPEETQLGLFSGREAAAFNRARADTALADADAQARFRAEEDRAHLELGQPVLEWIGEAR